VQVDPTSHIADVIQETLYRRVQNTINQYIEQNADAFAENKIAGVEWNLGLTVLVDNLGLNPQPKPKSLFKRLINAIKNFRKEIK
jgi:hypothetical protein